MSEPSKSKHDLVTIGDVSEIYCVWGIRRWFAQRGWDLRDFIANGMPVERLLSEGDELSARVVERKLNGKQ